MIIQVLTPFDSTKQAIEGTANFRANASYSWSWLIEHSNQQNTLISQINSTTTEMNSLAQTVTTKATEVANNTATVNQAKLDAQSARDAAIAAKNLAEAVYDNFDDRYLDTHATAPTVDNDGNALRIGALYFNSTNSKMYVYDATGAKWVDMMYIPTLLSSLSDIVFGSKANNDVIQYDSATGKWVNRSFYSKAELDAFIDIHSKTAKTTPVDADEIMVANSATGWSLVKITYANFKTALTSLFIPKVTSPTIKALAKILADGTIGNSSIIEDTSGFVGIGTLTPARKLEVQSYGTAGQSGIFRVSAISPTGTILNTALCELSITGAGGGTITQSIYARYNNGYELATYFADRFALRDNATNTERFAIDSAGNMFVPSAYSNTTAAAANMFVGSDSKFYRSTSSKQYKTDIETIDKSYVDKFFDNAKPIYYKSLSEIDNPNWGYWGFIAEDIAQFDKRLVHWRYQTKDVEVEKEIFIPAVQEVKDDEDNILVEAKEATTEIYKTIEQIKDDSKPLVAEGVMYERITVLLTAKVQEQKKIIDSLIARIEKLEINK